MIKALLFDFSRTILFPKNRNYQGQLNVLHKELSAQKEYRFLDYFELDQELLDVINGYKDEYEMYIFTSGSVQNLPEIKSLLDQIFTQIFSGQEMGISKDNTSAYKIVSEKIGFTPNEILFVDDSEKNITAAKKAGMDVILYKDLQGLKKKLKDLTKWEKL